MKKQSTIDLFNKYMKKGKLDKFNNYLIENNLRDKFMKKMLLGIALIIIKIILIN